LGCSVARRWCGHAVGVPGAGVPGRRRELWGFGCHMQRIVPNEESFLAHYLLDAYGYGSEELLRAVRIAIRPQTLTS
jgi:hypothetical protein